MVVFLLNRGRGDMIRTCDILLPKQALYQTELRPETFAIIIAFYINANFYMPNLCLSASIEMG